MDEVPFKQLLYNCMLEYNMFISRAQVIISNYHIVGVNGTLERHHITHVLALSMHRLIGGMLVDLQYGDSDNYATSTSTDKIYRANEQVQAVGGEWPARVILIAWGAEMEPTDGFHPIESVVHDMKDQVSFYNIGAELELNLLCIDDDVSWLWYTCCI